MVDKIRETLANNLLFYRKKAGLTQAQAAKSCKISLRSVQRAEDPEYEGMDVGVILALANGLKVHPSKLFLDLNGAPPIDAEEALKIVGKALGSSENWALRSEGDPDIERIAKAMQDDEDLKKTLLSSVREWEREKRKGQSSKESIKTK